MKRFRGAKLFVIAMLCLLPLAVSRADDCNGTYYDPGTQVCCTDYGGQQIVVDGGTCPSYCVGSAGVNPYDPNTQDCCDGVVYDRATQECCGNIVVPLGQCCSGQPFNPETQTCCTDGHIADIGQCDPPPLCNNEPFDPVTQECCGSLIVPLGHCCNGTSYDPTIQICCGGAVYYPWDFAGGVGCCNDQVYDINLSGLGCCSGEFYTLSEQTCCGGVLFDPSVNCCNGLFTYDPATYDCCGDGTLAPKDQCGWLACGSVTCNPATHGCCEGQVYELGAQECCGGTVVSTGNCCNNTPIDPLLQGCCNNEPYNLMTQECCGGLIVPAGGCCNGLPLEPGYGCCNNEPYDLMALECCGNTLVPQGRCCNGTPFEPDWQDCCQGQVVYTRDGNECCADGRVVPSGQCGWPTCSGDPYDASTHGCCNGQLYDRATQDCCHDSQPYDIATQTCCEGGTVVMNGEPCPQPPQLCGSTVYDPNLGQDCCNGTVIDLSSQCCMNNVPVNRTSSGECPPTCGESVYYPEANQSCCNGYVYDYTTHVCCGDGPVPMGYCCGAQYFDPATQECCGDGSVAPTDQCGWPVCGGQRYDPNSGLECCNGQTYDPVTQVCCDGATLVDIGQCHPSFCNNVPFDPGSEECCNGEIVPLGNCCGNQIINPATQGCGGGQMIYDLATEDYCPDGRVVPKGQCDWPSCGGVPYDNMTYECCADNTLAAIGQCPPPPSLCNGQPYDPATHDCCGDGRIVPSGQCNWPTCNGQPYDPDTQDCCSDGNIALKNQCNDTADCNGTIYNPNNYECCGEAVVPIGHCCSDMNGNWTVYNPAIEDCCGGAGGMLVAPRGTCPIECGGVWINPATTGCCQSEPYSLATYKCCGTPTVHVASIGEPCMDYCGQELYNTDTHQCCNNQVIPLSDLCYPECSPGVTYNPDTQECCNGFVYALATQECCYNEVVNKGECPELSVWINTDGGKPCVTGVGNPVAFIASASNAFGTVTYSWNFGGGHTTRTEGEGPINATFDGGGQAEVDVTATDTFIRGGQTFERFAYTNVIVNVAKITFVHAAGDTAGAPMDYIPIWTPNDGVDKGPPILDSPAPVFQMTPAGATMSATFLGTDYALTRDQTDPLFYTDASSGLTVRLNQEPLNDPNVAEYLEVIVSLPFAGITNSRYACDETAANSSVFTYTPPGLVMTVGPLDETQPDTVTLNVYQNSAASFAVTETGANTLVFTNSTVTASLLCNPSATSPLIVALTAAGFDLSNTVVQLAPYGGSVYRNFAPPIPTSMPPASVPPDAAFYVQVQGTNLDNAVNQPITLSIGTSSGNVQIGQLDLTPASDGGWKTTSPSVLCAGDPMQITSADQANYTALSCPPNVILGGGQSSTQGKGVVVSLQLPNVTITTSTNVCGDAVAIESLQVQGTYRGLVDWSSQSLQCFGVISNLLVNLGFHTYADRNACFVNRYKYFEGKEVWYSLMHGSVDKDDGLFNSLVTRFDSDYLSVSAINYVFQFQGRGPMRLVIANSCCSAQTLAGHEEEASDQIKIEAAIANPTMLQGAKTFADAFISVGDTQLGAYVGWKWFIGAAFAESAAANFLSRCVGKSVNVGTAYGKLMTDFEETAPNIHLMMLYGANSVVVDLRNNGPSPFLD